MTAVGAIFGNSAPILDDFMATTYQQAQRQGKVMRYAATLAVTDAGVQAKVELLTVAADHPLAAIQACDNVFVIESDWYQANPLGAEGAWCRSTCDRGWYSRRFSDFGQTTNCCGKSRETQSSTSGRLGKSTGITLRI